MPKHSFRFPPVVGDAIKRHIIAAAGAVDPSRFHQEANYIAALAIKLDGVAYKGDYGWVSFQSTVFDDRGRNSAESRIGADFAITATITDGTTTIRKAILIQAKLGRVENLSEADIAELKNQIRKMKHLVGAPKVLEIPEQSGCRFPAMISGNSILSEKPYRAIALPEYFVQRVTTTLDGCTNPNIVDAVQESSLSRIDVAATLHRWA